jgi:N-acetylmuramoyl-L-alanine amidase
MKGDDVKALQVYLNTHGYILAKKGNGSPGNESTYFGYITQTALMKFQKAHGLKADGVAGPKTEAVME